MATGNLLEAVGDEEEQGQPGKVAGQEAQELEGGGIGPVLVLQQEDHRPKGRQGGEKVAYPDKERPLVGRPTTAEVGRWRNRGGVRHPIERLTPGAVRRRLA